MITFKNYTILKLSVDEPEQPDGLITFKNYTILKQNIEVEVIDKDLSETERICNQCGGELTEIAVDVDRKVKLVPAKFIIAETRTHSYKCVECDKNNAGGSQRTGTKSAEQSYMWLYRTGSQHI